MREVVKKSSLDQRQSQEQGQAHILININNFHSIDREMKITTSVILNRRRGRQPWCRVKFRRLTSRRCWMAKMKSNMSGFTTSWNTGWPCWEVFKVIVKHLLSQKSPVEYQATSRFPSFRAHFSSPGLPFSLPLLVAESGGPNPSTRESAKAMKSAIFYRPLDFTFFFWVKPT